jgi:arylformamidase
MPHILSKIIKKNSLGLWGEGSPYATNSIYDIRNQTEKSPPVNYDAHILKPHSLPHLDAPAHVLENGHTVDVYFRDSLITGFYGRTLVIRLKGNSFSPCKVNENVSVWTVSKEQLESNIKTRTDREIQRLIITLDDYPEDSQGNHDQNKVLVLGEDAASWLIQKHPKICMYGTSWKSTDYRPGSKERPIHKLLFNSSITIFECLDLKNVPAGEYFWFGFPLPLEGASESPVCPVLFTKEEVIEFLNE